jgi:glycosyltransferase involved in cell wall biosynthesis
MPADPEEIADKIIQLIKNPDLMEKIKDNNLKNAYERYDAKVVSDQLVDVYYKI